MNANNSFFKTPEIDAKRTAVLLISFFAGSVLGLAVLNNSFIDFSSVYASEFAERGFLLFDRFKFHILSVVLGCSALGIFFLPVIAFCKGLSVSFVSMIVFGNCRFYVLSDAFLCYAVGEFILTGFLLVICCVAFSSSVIVFRSVFVKKEFFRREAVLSSLFFSFVLLIILIIIYSAFSLF